MPTDTPMPTITPRFLVKDLVKWGNLVKMWSTQQPYRDIPVMPIPRDLVEFRKQCAAIGLEVVIPETVTGLAVSLYSPEVLYLRIPPANMIKNMEAYLMDERTDYPVPAIYNMYATTEIKIPKAEKLEFHAARIGDYTVAQCGG